ncbi:HalOD1 output domain-containing protein [Natrialbaceae archaeon AArc-T1-2]|uniref:HalOD1 output domain-containing protein n=1 Tax=Natrialbaceae archaeon AArc-T1-2 TaxID=3053904 RepID=UPI00255AC69E|nr:HalOD1 output domain-containing protein [Natrialbaceae archaeon AArc-T1-2]WIV66025.1 hypothetical protein QQ977_09990 [Natrialbaceae archaeon AArc-T1-2]
MARDDYWRLNRDGCVAVRTVHGDPDAVVQAILRGVAAVENDPVTELDPLYDRIETEALVDLLEHARESDSTVGIEFTVDDYTVAVADDGTVCIHDGRPAVTRLRY